MKIQLYDILCTLEQCRGKKIIVFGKDKKAKSLVEMLKLFDVEPAYFVDFVDDEYVDEDICVKSCYRLLEEDKNKVFVLLTESPSRQEQCTKMEELGFFHLENFSYFFNDLGRLGLKRHYPLDPNLGYGLPTKMTGKIGGGRKFNEGGKVRVAVLGGSTSDSCRYEWKSWPEIACEKLCKKGLEVSVLSAAVSGYTSSEELFKLIRDVVGWRPDIVVSYSGINDARNIRTRTPYINDYQKKVISKIKLSNIVGDVYTDEMVSEYSYGDEMLRETSEIWIENEKMMHAICACFDIKFIGILQPWLLAKPFYTDRESELIELIQHRLMNNSTLFYSAVQAYLSERKQDYIIDGSHWLDSMSDIYYDRVHVTENGNVAIADKIIEVLEGYIYEAIEKKKATET